MRFSSRPHLPKRTHAHGFRYSSGPSLRVTFHLQCCPGPSQISRGVLRSLESFCTPRHPPFYGINLFGQALGLWTHSRSESERYRADITSISTCRSPDEGNRPTDLPMTKPYLYGFRQNADILKRPTRASSRPGTHRPRSSLGQDRTLSSSNPGKASSRPNLIQSRKGRPCASQLHRHRFYRGHDTQIFPFRLACLPLAKTLTTGFQPLNGRPPYFNTKRKLNGPGRVRFVMTRTTPTSSKEHLQDQ